MQCVGCNWSQLHMYLHSTGPEIISRQQWNSQYTYLIWWSRRIDQFFVFSNTRRNEQVPGKIAFESRNKQMKKHSIQIYMYKQYQYLLHMSSSWPDDQHSWNVRIVPYVVCVVLCNRETYVNKITCYAKVRLRTIRVYSQPIVVWLYSMCS